MGLLLSVLVACVGVVELFAFYANVSRSLVTVSTQTSFNQITDKYLEGLEQHRRNLQSIIYSELSNDCEEEALEIAPVEIVEIKERPPTPSKKPKVNGGLVPCKGPTATTNEDKDTNGFADNVSIQTREKSLQKNGVVPNGHVKTDVTSESVTKQEVLSISEEPPSRSPSPIPKRLGEQEVAFRRSPSPYPNLVLSAPRNSICNELDNSVSIAEVDEESISRSSTPEKLQLLLESKHNTTEYWTNKILVAPPTKSTKLNSDSLSSVKSDLSFVETSVSTKSEVRQFSLESLPNKDNELENDKEYDEQFLDSLDGVKKKKLSRSSSLRRSRKKKNIESKDDSLSSSSMQNNETAKTLTDAANVLKTVNQEDGPSSSAGTSKTAEPFWVNC